MRWPQAAGPAQYRPDDGFTLVELLLVVVILAVLTAVAALLVTGMTTEAAETGCAADRHQLDVAVGAYEAQTRNPIIAPSGDDDDPDRYERGLVVAGFLRDVSELHDVQADGTITPEDSRC
jgi:prepilin-type N-terminal cleavage/methylation domain-containing protein